MENNKNNFDLLRLFFALDVFFFHSSTLSQKSQLAPLVLISSETAIQGFFIISGYLIIKSYLNSSGLADYLSKRARRILPAYVFVVLFCALAGSLFSTLAAGQYFASGQFWRYLGANLCFMNWLQPTLPGVFAANPEPFVNGSLWTLKIEVAFYIIVPLVAWLFLRFNKTLVYLGIYIASVSYFTLLSNLDGAMYKKLAIQLPGQMSYFVTGGYLYLYRKTFMKFRHWIGPACLVLFWISLYTGWEALRPLGLGGLVIYLACGIRYLGNFSRYGDMSYGAYIYHFPIVQALIVAGLYQFNPYAATAAGFVILLLFSNLSWHLLEKRFLLSSSHYRQMSDAPERP